MVKKILFLQNFPKEIHLLANFGSGAYRGEFFVYKKKTFFDKNFYFYIKMSVECNMKKGA